MANVVQSTIPDLSEEEARLSGLDFSKMVAEVEAEESRHNEKMALYRQYLPGALKKAREDNHLSQRGLAKLIGVSNPAIAGYETGDKNRVGLTTLKRAAQVFEEKRLSQLRHKAKN